MSVIASLDWTAVRDHYDIWANTHKNLLDLFRTNRNAEFIELLGISDSSGNYIASEHGIGPKIIAENARV